MFKYLINLWGIFMKLLICSLLTICISNSFATQIIPLGPEKVGRSDSGIYGPTYEQMKLDMQDLVASNPEFAQIINLGLSEDGTETLGILIGKKDVPIKKLVMTSGSTHGNEYLGIVDSLPKAFLDRENEIFYDFYQQGGGIVVVPVLNPYGYEERRRYNINYRDLNRDFSNLITGVIRFTQSETRNVKNWGESYTENTGASLKVSVDYHCCYGGALLFPWAYTTSIVMPDEDLQKHVTIAEFLADQFPGIEYGPTGDIIWYSADGTSKDYWHAKYGATAFTYEGRYRDEKDFLPEHIAWWKDIVRLHTN